MELRCQRRTISVQVRYGAPNFNKPMKIKLNPNIDEMVADLVKTGQEDRKFILTAKQKEQFQKAAQILEDNKKECEKS